MKITTKDVLREIRDRARPWLTGSQGQVSKYYDLVREIYPVHASRSGNENIRFNLLIPTAKPEKIYGGVASAFKIAKEMIEGLHEGSDVRVIVTSDSVDKQSVTEISNRLGRAFIIGRPNQELNGSLVSDFYQFKSDPIPIRKNDIFFATAWWTADLGFRLIDLQKKIFNHSFNLVYLIQDFEPGFYPWSNHYAASEATYHRGVETLALINSEELFNFMSIRYKFKNALVVPYSINEEITKNIKKIQKEKIILVYGRPSASRNCFELIVEALRLWQLRDPLNNTQFKIKFVGESFSESLISELESASVLGKLSIADYADLLSRSSIGIALMISPHPSYPPLEMAYSGLITITNQYKCKNLSLRSKNIVSVSHVSPISIANALDESLFKVNQGINPEFKNLLAAEIVGEIFTSEAAFQALGVGVGK